MEGGETQEKFSVGDLAWNKRESSLDLKPGWLIQIVEVNHNDRFPYRGRPLLIHGDYSDVGYYFNYGDLERIPL